MVGGDVGGQLLFLDVATTDTDDEVGSSHTDRRPGHTCAPARLWTLFSDWPQQLL